MSSKLLQPLGYEATGMIGSHVVCMTVVICSVCSMYKVVHV